jgi:hypothetical protein
MPGPVPQYPLPLTLEQEVHLQPLRTCSTGPFAEVQRARILLLAHPQPPWRPAEIARPVGCCVKTVQHGRPRWLQTDTVRAAPRAGTRRTFTPLQRAQISALACRAPRAYGQPWPRWAGETLAQGAVAQQIVAPLSSRGRSVPGCARTRATPGASTRGSIRLIHTVWTRPRQRSISTNTPRRWQRRGKRGCAGRSRPPSQPGSVSARPRPRRPGPRSTSRLGLNAWGPCNCSVPWWSLRG